MLLIRIKMRVCIGALETNAELESQDKAKDS